MFDIVFNLECDVFTCVESNTMQNKEMSKRWPCYAVPLASKVTARTYSVAKFAPSRIA